MKVIVVPRGTVARARQHRQQRRLLGLGADVHRVLRNRLGSGLARLLVERAGLLRDLGLDGRRLVGALRLLLEHGDGLLHARMDQAEDLVLAHLGELQLVDARLGVLRRGAGRREGTGAVRRRVVDDLARRRPRTCAAVVDELPQAVVEERAAVGRVDAAVGAARGVRLRDGRGRDALAQDRHGVEAVVLPLDAVALVDLQRLREERVERGPVRRALRLREGRIAHKRLQRARRCRRRQRHDQQTCGRRGDRALSHRGPPPGDVRIGETLSERRPPCQGRSRKFVSAQRARRPKRSRSRW